MEEKEEKCKKKVTKVPVTIKLQNLCYNQKVYRHYRVEEERLRHNILEKNNVNNEGREKKRKLSS